GLLAGPARGGEELDVAHDAVVVALAALRVPLAELDAPVNRHQPALAEVLVGGLAGFAEDGDVDVADLAVAAHPVDRDAQFADARAARQRAQLGVPGQTAGADVLVDVHCGFSFG